MDAVDEFIPAENEGAFVAVDILAFDVNPKEELLVFVDQLADARPLAVRHRVASTRPTLPPFPIWGCQLSKRDNVCLRMTEIRLKQAM